MAEDIEKYIRETTLMMEKKLLSEWASKTTSILQSELRNSESVLAEEASQMLSQSGKQLLNKTKTTTLSNAEAECMSRGLQVHPSKIAVEDLEEVRIDRKPLDVEVNIPTASVSLPEFDPRIHASDPEEVRSEAFQLLDSHLRKFQDAMIDSLNDLLDPTIDQHFAKIRKALSADVQHKFNDIERQITTKNNQIYAARIDEIKGSQPFTFRSSKNLSEEAFYPPARSSPSNSVDRPVEKPRNKPNGQKKEPSSNMPRTSVSATLSQFLKYEEMQKFSNKPS